MKKINEGEELINMLKNNLMTGKLQDSGRYRFKVKKEHSFGKEQEFVKE